MIETGGSAPTAPLKYVFLVGCPRSGSSWTALLLASHPEVVAFQHAKLLSFLHPMDIWWRRKIERFGSSIVQVDEAGVRYSAALDKEHFYELTSQYGAAIFDQIAQTKSGAGVVVDKTPENSRLAPFILRLFPNAYFLHIIRDPRSTFVSQRAASRSWANGEFPTEPFDGGAYWQEWVAAGRAIGDLTDRYREVHYEAWHERGPAELAEIYAWLGLPVDAEQCAAAFDQTRIEKVKAGTAMPQGFYRQGKKAEWRTALTPREIRAVEHTAGALMGQLGYQAEAPPLRQIPLGVRLRQAASQRLTGRKSILFTRRLRQKLTGRKGKVPEFTIY